MIEPNGEPQNFAERMHVLMNRFKFGAINYDNKIQQASFLWSAADSEPGLC